MALYSLVKLKKVQDNETNKKRHTLNNTIRNLYRCFNNKNKEMETLESEINHCQEKCSSLLVRMFLEFWHPPNINIDIETESLLIKYVCEDMNEKDDKILHSNLNEIIQEVLYYSFKGGSKYINQLEKLDLYSGTCLEIIYQHLGKLILKNTDLSYALDQEMHAKDGLQKYKRRVDNILKSSIYTA